MEWTPYNFALFGLTCDIFRGAQAAIRLDPQTPNQGYLAQSADALGLMVIYGAEAEFDAWVQMALAGPEAEMVEERTQATLCGYPAARAVLRVVPPPPAEGHRAGPRGPEPLGAESAEPFLLIVLGAAHRGTPLLAVFRRPVSSATSEVEAEALFFASFRCEA